MVRSFYFHFVTIILYWHFNCITSILFFCSYLTVHFDIFKCSILRFFHNLQSIFYLIFFNWWFYNYFTNCFIFCCSNCVSSSSNIIYGFSHFYLYLTWSWCYNYLALCISRVYPCNIGSIFLLFSYYAIYCNLI